jgi:hypothetical protein
MPGSVLYHATQVTPQRSVCFPRATIEDGIGYGYRQGRAAARVRYRWTAKCTSSTLVRSNAQEWGLDMAHRVSDL